MKFLFLAIGLFPSITFANFSGTWTGEAQLTTKQGQVYLCEEVTINVNQAATHVTFGQFTYACDNYAFTFVPPTLQITGSKVFYKNKFNNEIGTVTEDAANLLFKVNPQNGRARYTVNKISDTQIDYTDEQIDVNTTTGQDEILTIHADLTKVDPATMQK